MNNEKLILTINQNLEKYMAPQKANIIYQAMAYSLLGKGKRIRPTIMILSCQAVGGSIKKAMPFACALEMIHTYSLVHDDLPAMDNDTLRRGLPTNHIAHGEAMAILAGDGLLNMAWEIMARHCLTHPNKDNIKAMEIIGASSGVKGMIGGQVMDINTTGENISGETLLYIHSKKTAALISAAFSAGAILGGGSKKTVSTLTKAGYYLGLAYQIKDDYLDITENKETTGKDEKSDIKNNKATYVSLYGKERCIASINILKSQIISLLKDVNLNTKKLEELTIQLLNY